LTVNQYGNCNGPTSFGAQVVSIYLCPSDNVPNPVSTYTTGGVTYYMGLNSYGCNGGTRSWYVSSMTNDGMMYLNSSVKMAGVRDGPSNTLLYGERFHYDPNWTGINTLGGWAWANYNAGQDYVFSAPVPVNYMCPAANPSQTITDNRT